MTEPQPVNVIASPEQAQTDIQQSKRQVFGLVDRIRTRLGNPNVKVDPIDVETAQKFLEGNELIQTAQSHLRQEAQEQRAQEQEKSVTQDLKEQRLKADSDAKRIRLLDKLAQKGQLTPEDEDFLEQFNDPNQLPEVRRISLIKELNRAIREENESTSRLREARGQLPNETLKKEAALVSQIETAESQRIASGKALREQLSQGTDPNSLRQACEIDAALEKSARQQSSYLDRLQARLIKRYPDQAEVIRNKRGEINDRQNSGIDRIQYQDPAEFPQEQLLTKVDELAREYGLADRDEFKADLAKRLGVVAETDENGNPLLDAEGDPKQKVEAGLLVHNLMIAEANRTAFDQAFNQAMEASQENPRLAGEALKFALLRRHAESRVEVYSQRIKREGLDVQASLKIQVAKEIAIQENNQKKLLKAQEWDKRRKSSKLFIARIRTAPNIARGKFIEWSCQKLDELVLKGMTYGSGVKTAAESTYEAFKSEAQAKFNANEVNRKDQLANIDAQIQALLEKRAQLEGNPQTLPTQQVA